MRSLKFIALAAVAAIALLTATSAMAEPTQLCRVDESPCAESNVVTHLHSQNIGETKAIALTSVGNVTCGLLLALGDTLGAGEPLVVHGNVTFAECKLGTTNCTVTEISSGVTGKVSKTGHETAIVTGLVGEVNIHCGTFVNCTYDGEGIEGFAKGPLLSSAENGEVGVSEQELHRVAGLFCPKVSKLDDIVTSLEAIYLSE